MRHDWSDYIGQTIDRRFVLNSYCGQENGLAIFSASHPDLPQGAIVRLMPAELPAAEGQERSWALASRFQHPNLLRVAEAGRTDLDGEEYIYCLGERPDDSVAEVLPKRALDAAEARQVLEAILPALRYLHEHGVVHGALSPAAIVAVGDSVKLTTDTVFPAVALDSDVTVFEHDIRSLGATLVQLLTQRRPELTDQSSESGDLRLLPAPFREIAAGTLESHPEHRWTLEDAERALAGLPVVRRRTARVYPEPEPVAPAAGAARSRRTGAMVVAAGAVVLLGGIVMVRPRAPQPVNVRAEPAVVAPPVASAARKAEPPAALPPKRIEQAPAAAAPAGPWGVVAAIYRDHSAAEKRARQIRSRWSAFPAHVIPPAGKGNQYMVVLATGLSRPAAESLSKRAKSAGLPRDTYVTKISTD